MSHRNDEQGYGSAPGNGRADHNAASVSPEIGLEADLSSRAVYYLGHCVLPGSSEILWIQENEIHWKALLPESATSGRA